MSNSSKPFPYRLVDYPARLRAEQVGQILGFEQHEIPVLIGKKLLTPLGKPVPNAQKFFAAETIIGLSKNTKWLEKATRALYSYWHGKNQKKKADQQDLTGKIPVPVDMDVAA
jgi:hypothetical protein